MLGARDVLALASLPRSSLSGQRQHHGCLVAVSSIRPSEVPLPGQHEYARLLCAGVLPTCGTEVGDRRAVFPQRGGSNLQPPCRDSAKAFACRKAKRPRRNTGATKRSKLRGADEEAASSCRLGRQEIRSQGAGLLKAIDPRIAPTDAQDRPCTAGAGLRGDPSASSSPAPLPFQGEFGFVDWTRALIRLTLRSGTSFASFLRKTLSLCRSDADSAPTALYPLPMPDDVPVSSRARRMKGGRTNASAVAVALHVIVMALNFLHAGGKHIPTQCLRRPPAPVHLQVYDRLKGLIQASARQTTSIPFCPGRRGTHIVARLNELADFPAGIRLWDLCI